MPLASYNLQVPNVEEGQEATHGQDNDENKEKSFPLMKSTAIEHEWMFTIEDLKDSMLPKTQFIYLRKLLKWENWMTIMDAAKS